MTHRRGSQAGFTLLEVLIALSLMAVLSLLSWRALDTTARSHAHLESHDDVTLGIMRALGQLETDLAQHAGAAALPSDRHHVDRAVSVSGVTFGGTGSGGDAADLNSVLPPGIGWQSPQLTVVRALQDGTWQEVVWTLRADKLTRAAGAGGVQLPLPAAQQAEPLLSGVNEFVVRAWLPGQGWATVAPAGAPAATGLEIAIRRTDGATYRKVLVLP